MSAYNDFVNQCISAKYACDNFDSTQDFEPFLLRVLLFVKSNPLHVSDFKEYFTRMLHDPNLGPWELIEFCMRDLQWPEILEAAKRRMSANADHRIKAVMAKIIAVYQQNWEDRDLYKYYSNSQSPKN